MPSNKTIFIAVNNDLRFDQRMQKTCNSLINNGFSVLLIGRTASTHPPKLLFPFPYKLLYCPFKKGMMMYAWFNIYLFFYLMFTRWDKITAVDLDTILPCWLASTIKGKPRMYDAHELFTEMKEVVTRPFIQNIWKKIEAFSVPKFQSGYTVNQFIANYFKAAYGVEYHIIYNYPTYYAVTPSASHEPYFLYQGAVNEGRGFEYLIPAMRDVNTTLWIVGEGNFLKQAKALVIKNQLQHKIKFLGALPPSQLKEITQNCYAGITIFEAVGLNQIHSLSNRFFDYMMAEKPQICVSYPEYLSIVKHHPFALLIDDISVATLSKAMNKLIENTVMYEELSNACIAAKHVLNWEQQEQQLVAIYQQ